MHENIQADHNTMSTCKRKMSVKDHNLVEQETQQIMNKRIEEIKQASKEACDNINKQYARLAHCDACRQRILECSDCKHHRVRIMQNSLSD